MNQDLAFKISATVSGQQAIDKFKKSISDISGGASSLKSGIGTLTSGLKILAAAFAVKEIVDFGKSLIDSADEIRGLAEKTGVGVQELASFKVAAEEADLSMEGLTTGLKKLGVSQVEARNGSKELVAAFRNVGISASDLRNLTTGELTQKLADNFSKLKDGPEKAANAIKLFGRSGTDMIPFLNQGSAELIKFKGALDEDLANRADEFNDSITRIKNNIKEEGFKGLKVLLPTFKEITKAVENIKIGSTTSLFEALSEAIRITAVAAYALSLSAVDAGEALGVMARLAKVSVMGVLDEIADRINTTVEKFKALANLDFGRIKQLGIDLTERSNDRGEEVIAARDKLFGGFVERQKQRAESLRQFKEELLGEKSGSILFGGGVEQSRRLTAPDRPKSASATNAPGSGGLGSGAGELDRIKQFIALQKQENEQREQSIQDIGKSTLELAKLKEARELDRETLKLAKGDLNNLTEADKAQIAALREERLALIERDYAMKRTFSTGAKEAFRDYVESATDAAKNTKELFSNAFKGMEDALVSFVKTGKFDFASFADSIISDMIRIAVRQAILGPLLGAIGGAFGSIGSSSTGGGTTAGGGGAGAPSISAGFANGGIMTARGSVPLKKYANGGVATSPQLALFGEGSRPEAYVPLPDGRRIPVVQQGGGGGVNVVVNVAMDSGGQDDAKSSSSTGKQLGQLIASAVKAELVNQKRPGGLLAG